MLAGRYRVVGELGRGGQGEVLAAVDTWDLGMREVALKRVPRAAHATLAAEFWALRSLRHPSLVEALDLFLDTDNDIREDTGASAGGASVAYLVEERVDGDALGAWATGRGEAEVCATLAPVAHALAQLHVRGLVHLDPSPRNILVASGGGPARAVLIDLGLSRPVGSVGAAGTPGFIAPELLAGGAAEGAADIYALAVTLAVALGADVPAAGTPVRPPAGLSEQLGRLLTAALREAPASRPDAVELAHELCGLGRLDPQSVLRPCAEVPLCGRATELDAFERWLESGAPALRLTGPAGVGKSALLGRCADRARTLGHPVIEVTADDPRASAQIAVRATRVLGVAGEDLDALGLEPLIAPTGEARDPKDLGERLVLGLDAAAGGRTLLVFVDDVERAPAALAHALAVWTRRAAGLSGARVILSGGEGASDGERTLAVPPLALDGVRELLRAAYGEERPAAEAERLIELCGRMPRALSRGVRALANAGGTALTLAPEDVGGDAAPLPASLRPLALADGPVGAEVIRRLASDRAAADVTVALRSGVLEMASAGGEPSYRVPEALRAALDPDARIDAHRRLAEALRGAGEDLRAVAHFAAAGDVETAVEALRGAGEEGAEATLHALTAVAARIDVTALGADVVERWAHLAAGASDVEVAGRAAEALAALGRPDAGHLAVAKAARAAGSFDEALEAVRRVTEGPARAALEARILYFLGRVEAALDVAQGAAGEARGELRLDVLDVLGHSTFALGDAGKARAILAAALTEAHAIGDTECLSRAQQSLAIVLHRSGDVAGAAPLYEESLRAARGITVVTRTVNLATCCQDGGELGRALGLYRRAHSLAVALDNPRQQARVGLNLANLEVLLGELAVGARRAASTHELCRAAGMHHVAGMAALVMAEAALERQAVEDAREALALAEESLAQIEDPVAKAEHQLLTARAQAADGDSMGALGILIGVEPVERAPHIARQLAFWQARIGSNTSGPTLAAAREAAERAYAAATEARDEELRWRAAAVRYRTAQRLGEGDAEERLTDAREALAAFRERLDDALHAAYFSSSARRLLLRWLGGGAGSAFPMSTASPDVAYLRRLVAINRRLAREQNVDALLELIVDTAIELLGAERGFLILREEAGIRVAVARNFDRRKLEDGSHFFSRSIAATVVEAGEAVLTTNAQEDVRFAEIQSVTALRVRSVLCVPLRGTARDDDPLIGVVYLDHRFQERAFTETDVDLCQSFADQAAIALENARLLARTREQEQRLARQNERLERFNTELQKQAASYAEEAEAALRRLREEGPRVGVGTGFERFVGRSDKLREALRLIDRFADTDVPVFIHGESGTGKELVARAIHERSRRSRRPLVTLNCGAVPENLIESELFGYRKGAFTGATRDKAGLFAAAEGGTLLLDEIGEMPMSMQVKLLRVLQEREFRPVGATRTVTADVRILSASHRRLPTLVERGVFREDLFYRLQVVEIVVPPLRDRREDVPLLVEHFCREIRKVAADQIFTRAAMGCLLAYDWPGNVRELQNEVHRALALADDRVDVEGLSEKLQRVRGGGAEALAHLSRGSLRDILDGFEREVLLATLKRTGWNVRKAAQELGLSRAAMYTRLNRFGITRE